jgi:hypothetical protein
MRLDRMRRRRIFAGWIKFFLRSLTDLELEALRQIAVHPATRHIPYRVQSRLKDIGYAKEVLGGLVLTDDGLQRIAIDRERIRTLID